MSRHPEFRGKIGRTRMLLPACTDFLTRRRNRQLTSPHDARINKTGYRGAFPEARFLR